ncbi:hypothetical protein F5B20DRAFT_267476 [Whalleya microplaca]|nr:hypothetical protein F5B20DRAFT_267476 [Whalleya microplaca]
MGSKRSADNEAGNANKKRRDGKTSASAIDPTYGQRGAFGSLQDQTTAPTGDSDLDCEDDTEALAYLRSVRVQASTIPHILAAKRTISRQTPQIKMQSSDTLGDEEIKEEDEDEEDDDIDRSIYRDGKGDFRGYYHDGAYTAYPAGYFDEEDEEEDYKDEYEEGEGEAQEGSVELDYEDEESSFDSSEGGPHNSSADEIRDAYFTSLANKFLALRKILQTPPPESLLAALPKSNPTEVGEFGRDTWTFVKWSGRMRGTDPLPAQVAGMHKDGVVRLLRILLNGKFLRKNCALRERTSRWLWALLARLPDNGQLDYQEVGWIRELGKRAVLLMVSLADLKVLEEHYDVGGNGSQDEDAGEGEVDGDEELDEDLSQDGDVAEEESAGFTEAQDQASDDVQNGQLSEVNVASSMGKDGNGADGAPADPLEPASHSKLNKHGSVDTSSNATKGKEIARDQAPKAAATGESSDVEMQIDSDMEDGEVSEPPPPQQTEPAADIERAKARLLAQLDRGVTAEEVALAEALLPAAPEQPTVASAQHKEEEREEEEARRQKIQRARINERATLNMILTVAGEFYGQRDLLEFRDPFGGLQLLENDE